MALIKIKEKRQPKKASAASSPASPGNRLHVVENAPKIKLNKTQKKATKKQPKQKPVRGHVKRFLENREPKIVENPKTAMLLRSTTASQYILNVLRDIVCILILSAFMFALESFDDSSFQVDDKEERAPPLRRPELPRVLEQEERLQSLCFGL